MNITPQQAREMDYDRREVERTKDLTDEQLETQVFEERDARETARIEKESDEAIQAVTATRQQKRTRGPLPRKLHLKRLV